MHLMQRGFVSALCVSFNVRGAGATRTRDEHLTVLLFVYPSALENDESLRCYLRAELSFIFMSIYEEDRRTPPRVRRLIDIP